jgi:hypothetical protein
LKGLINFLTWLAIITCCSSALTQSVTTVETYGPVPATQPYSGLGTNITTPTNAWEYEDAEAAHITWARFDCNWIRAEIQDMPSNTSEDTNYRVSVPLGWQAVRHTTYTPC